MSKLAVRSLLLLLFLFLSAAVQAADVQGEWRRLGPEGGSVFDLAFSPSFPRVLYASVEGQVYRSADGGGSWTLTNLGDSRLPVTGLAVDPANPSRLYAARPDGFVRSLDGGNTWQKTGGFGRAFDVAVNPQVAGMVFAATATGLYRSTDSGATWKPFRLNGLPQKFRATLVVINPASPREIFVATETPGGVKGLFRSTDAGASWRPADSGPLKGKQVLALAKVPKSVLYAGTADGLYRGSQGGGSWTKTGPAGTGRVLALAITNNGKRVYAGTEKGLFRSLDSGATWARVSQGLPEGGAVTSLLVAPDNSVLAGVSAEFRRGGVFKSTDAGTSWTFLGSGMTATTVTSIAFGEPGTIWITANGALFRSADRGATWTRIRPGPPTASYPTSVAVDPVDPSYVYVALRDGTLRRSADGGATWTAVDPHVDTFLLPLTIAIDPETPSTLYLASSSIVRSTDHGATWTRLETYAEDVFLDFVVAPSDPRTLYAFRGVRILRSTDGWASFNLVTYPRSFQAYALAVDPLVSTTLYLATVEGVYTSTDGGRTWNLLSSVFGNQRTFPLETDPAGRLYAGVWLNGLYSIAPGDGSWSRLAGSGPWEFRTVAFDPHDPCRIYVGAVGQSLLVFTKSGTSECPGGP
ncbi:MAG TPA: YCF48-related protein [Thermoanaerobaculia bacterium]|jgi:photosystem II stability/assembly factor-like uncharacterized protein|nr:YCF48-related protein [Thermoanaerobaculia bacterium]